MQTIFLLLDLYIFKDYLLIFLLLSLAAYKKMQQIIKKIKRKICILELNVLSLQRIINFKNIKHMKRILFSVLVASGVSLIAPQTAKAQNQIDNGYEIEVVYNKTDKTTTVILYKDGVEVGRVTNPAN